MSVNDAINIVSPRTHGLLDYVMGILLIFLPWLFQFYLGGAETFIPIVLGAGIIFYSLLTDYSLGVVPFIPMNMHLLIDGLAGTILAISPWLFGFAELVYLPHLLTGVFEVGTAAITGSTSKKVFKDKPEI